MIAIDKGNKEVKKAQPKPSLSQQNHARRAVEQNEKKMTVEKAQRLKRAGLVK